MLLLWQSTYFILPIFTKTLLIYFCLLIFILKLKVIYAPPFQCYCVLIYYCLFLWRALTQVEIPRIKVVTYACVMDKAW